MMLRSFYARIALVFAVIVLTLGGLLGWAGYSQAKQHQHRILQQVNLGLASHIATQPIFTFSNGSVAANPRLFDQLTAVNPNIEVYLLDANGVVVQSSSKAAHLPQWRVSLEPVLQLIDGAPLPILGDNPQHLDGNEIFSAAPIKDADGVRGYVYIVLLNDMYRDMVASSWQQYMLRSGVWIFTLAVLVALIVGFAAFYAVTRRLQRTIRDINTFAVDSQSIAATTAGNYRGDEIDRLGIAFSSMRQRLDTQMQELRRQDELRRELVANVSHDLRTPLTSMQGYLETMLRMDDSLERDERRQYLQVAVRQSIKVSRLAQQLFELAKLECEETQPQLEHFSISELMQDIAQKFALSAEQKSIHLDTKVDAESMFVYGDIGMIERVITNLIDNAIRHTPQHGEVRLEAKSRSEGVEIRISDTGQGISAEYLPGLLERGSPLRKMAAQRSGGLGLLIANRMLSLHGSAIRAASRLGEGTSISFILPFAGASSASA